MYNKKMNGGDLFSSVADLTIPFGFLLGAQGVKYLKEMREKSHAQKGGEAGTCFLCQQDAQAMQTGAAARAMLRNEIDNITEDLKQLLADY